MNISLHDISALKVWISSLKNNIKINVTVWPKGNLMRTSVATCTSCKLFEKQFIKVTGEYKYVDSPAVC